MLLLNVDLERPNHRDEEEGESLTSVRAEDAMVARQTSRKKKTMIYFTNQSKEESTKWKFPPVDLDSGQWLLY